MLGSQAHKSAYQMSIYTAQMMAQLEARSAEYVEQQTSDN